LVVIALICSCAYMGYYAREFLESCQEKITKHHKTTRLHHHFVSAEASYTSCMSHRSYPPIGPIFPPPASRTTPHACEEGVQNTPDCGIVYFAVKP
jgi:hypothetical protein